ncbi:hypothetical protein PF005_g5264 [Phytophthora fragariae]|uniref:DUF659 domain-containing protein n=1 Tax=Phytophthora fragariae TaxID=53985 RepID=A0A6A3FG26_9STRA|nr:hypothetical protein PF009_g5699 [Phytophthora fragariae]KAE9135558.1 hypothetical protein PF007_g2515 [Phytophthora fragariae]KAE9226097.1 hypothetical protein PF005_g5264 [Phytophthora fragariae]KAE9322626.1 hypothetical protein PF001_g4304 [Phytophthora fragariae]
MGPASHRINLFSKKSMVELEDLAQAVSTLMVALRTVKNRAQLRRPTSIAVLRAISTRRNSTFTLLERYLHMRDAIKLIDTMLDIVPKPAVHRRIVAPKYAGLSAISKATLKKYLATLVALVEGSLSLRAGKLYALLFDGWSAGSDHFVAVFICYTKDGEMNMHLLAIAPLIDETNEAAPNHSDFILRTLERFNIDHHGAVCLIGDISATNISTARLLGVPLVDCSSHHLNLAADRVFKKCGVELDLIALVMRKRSTTKA